MSVERKQELAADILKMVKHYFTKHNLIMYAQNVDSDTFKEEWVSAAFCYVYEKKLDKYDENRSKLSTFVYMILSQQAHIFVSLANYSYGYNTSRKILNSMSKSIDGDYNSDLLDVYLYTSYDKEIISDDEDLTTTIVDKIPDIKVDDEYEEILNDNTFESVVNCIKKNKKISECNKAIFLDYINTLNYGETAKRFNISRQAVYVKCRKVSNILREDKNIKLLLNRD